LQEEIEVERARLEEDLRSARKEYDRLLNSDLSPEDRAPDGLSAAGFELAFENLKAAEMALHDFEVEHPPTS
jgi:GAF domain-containing protein